MFKIITIIKATRRKLILPEIKLIVSGINLRTLAQMINSK
jgi:hypothetical protein